MILEALHRAGILDEIFVTVTDVSHRSRRPRGSQAHHPPGWRRGPPDRGGRDRRRIPATASSGGASMIARVSSSPERAMSQLNAKKRAKLPKSAFAYVDSQGRRRLPINDESHVRNALARFNQVAFEDEAARERARKRLLERRQEVRDRAHRLHDRPAAIADERGGGRSAGDRARAGRHAGRVRAAAAHAPCATPRSRSCTGPSRPAPISTAPVSPPRCRRDGRGPGGDAARAPGPADDRPRARPRRPEESGPGEDGDGRGQAGGRERAAARPGRSPGQRSANPADRARDLPPDRYRRVDGPPPAAGRPVRRAAGRRPRHHPGLRASGGWPRGRRARGRVLRGLRSRSRGARGRPGDRADRAGTRLARWRRGQGPRSASTAGGPR